VTERARNKRPANKRPVAIAGGGIGGLACALALARRGFASVVLEQARDFGEAGVGLQVAPNALHVLDALGVGERAKKDAFLIERMVMADAVDGREILNIECGDAFRQRFGNPYAVAHRADIHGALLEGCREQPLVTLRTSSRVTAFDERGSGVEVALADGSKIEAEALIGADGVHSVIRKAIVNDGEPLPSGAMIYRAVIPAERMPKDLQNPYPILWAGPGTHIIYYPVRDWKVFNFGATIVTGATEVDETNDVLPAEVLPLFEQSCDTPLRVMRLPPSFKRYLIRHREPVGNWTEGKVTLLGDAAHPMVQYIAQGAAMALEDAICLGVCMDECDGNYNEAFKRYQDIRIVRASRVQMSSLMMDKINHASGVERLVRNSIFEGRTQEEHYDRLSWLYTAPPYVR
jgi:2-polyprenyl-6-methoxyphenol hydroxylase-like FAD-dependent oxidoreductase